MKWLVFVLCIIGSLIDIGLSVSDAENAENIDYRLNGDIEPINYLIELTPYLTDNDTGKLFTFDGSVTISLKATKADVKTITIHLNDLNITEQTLTIASGQSTTDQRESEVDNQSEGSIIDQSDYDAQTNKYKIMLTQALEQEKLYELKLKFSGKLRTDMVGFYRSSYKDGNETKYDILMNYQN